MQQVCFNTGCEVGRIGIVGSLRILIFIRQRKRKAITSAIQTIVILPHDLDCALENKYGKCKEPTLNLWRVFKNAKSPYCYPGISVLILPWQRMSLKTYLISGCHLSFVSRIRFAERSEHNKHCKCKNGFCFCQCNF